MGVLSTGPEFVDLQGASFNASRPDSGCLRVRYISRMQLSDPLKPAIAACAACLLGKKPASELEIESELFYYTETEVCVIASIASSARVGTATADTLSAIKLLQLLLACDGALAAVSWPPRLPCHSRSPYVSLTTNWGWPSP